MCAVSDGASVVAKLYVRVVVLLMCDLCNHINKRHGLVVVFEAEVSADCCIFCVQLPEWFGLL